MVAVSKPDKVNAFFFNLPNPSSRIIVLLQLANKLGLQKKLCPGVYSATNRNEYQKQKNNVSGE
jgi:hypothetical protein